MDKTYDLEIDENESLLTGRTSYQNLLNVSADKSKKSFIQRRRRGSGVLAELETISESNALSDYSARGNLSFFEFTRNKRRSDFLSQTYGNFPSSNLSSTSIFDSSLQTSPSKSGETQQTTPPGVLRQRIKEAKDVQGYLQKELDELRDFTTAELQILSAEKGVDALKENHTHLQLEFDSLNNQNSNLKMELEEMDKLNNSQRTLINDLKDNYELAKSELKTITAEKESLVKELENVKRKLTDEEIKNELAENKWKMREEELKKSLDEAWASLKVKEDRLLKMKDRISLLYYSERDTDTGDIFSKFVNPNEKKVEFHSAVADLFNLSVNHFETDPSLNVDTEKNIHENNKFEKDLSFETVNIELKKCQEALQSQNELINDLTKDLEEKKNYIQQINECHNNLSYSFEFHKKNDLQLNNDVQQCTIDHENIFEKICCEFSLLHQKLMSPSLITKCTSVLEELEEHMRKQDAVIESKSDPVEIHLDSVDTSKYKTITSDSPTNIILPELELSTTVSMHIPSIIIHPCTPDNNELIDDYKEKIRTLENELHELKRTVTCAKSNNCLSEEVDVHLVGQSANKSMQCLPDQAEVSCQTEEDIVLQDNSVGKNQILEETCTKETICLNRCFNDVSIQTTVNFLSMNEYEQKIKEFENSSQVESVVALTDSKEMSCQTEDVHVPLESDDKKILNHENIISCTNKSVQLVFENEEVSCQTEVDFVSLDTYAEKILALEAVISQQNKPERIEENVNNLDTKYSEIGLNLEHNGQLHCKTIYEDKIKELTCELEVLKQNIHTSGTVKDNHSIETQTHSDLFTTTYDNATSSAITNGSLNSLNRNDGSCTTLNTSSQTSGNDCLGLKEMSFCNALTQTEELQEGSDCISILSSNHEEDYGSVSTYFTSNTISDDHQSIDSCLRSEFSNKSEMDSSSSRDTIYESVSDVPAKTFDRTFHDMTLSDSIGDQEAKQNLRNRGMNNSVVCNSVLGEYIDIPASNTSGFELTFNYQLEHSILKSKLMPDESIMESFDPLSTESEIREPIIETPFLQSLNHIGESKLLQEKCKSLNDELESAIVVNKKSLSLLAEIVYLLLPKDSGSQHDILAKSEETLGIIKDFIQSPNWNGLSENHGILSSLEYFNKLSNNLLNLLSEVKSLKKDLLFLSSSVHSLRDINSVLKELEALFSKLNIIEERDRQTLYSEKCDLEKSNSTLKCNLDSIKEKLLTLRNVCVNFKSDFNSMSSDMLDIKSTFIQDLTNTTLDVEKYLEIKRVGLNNLFDENSKLKLRVAELTSSHDKYSELLESFEQIQTELKESKLKTDVVLSDFDSLKSDYSVIENENSELKIKISQYETDMSDQLKQIETAKKDLLKLELLKPINDQYNELLGSYSMLESELSLYKEESSKFLLLQDSLNAKIDELISENMKLKNSAAEQETKITEVINKVMILEKENECLTSKMKDLDSMTCINEKYTEMVQVSNELKKELTECKEVRSELEELNKSLILTIKQLESDNIDSRDKISQYEKNASALTENLRLLDNLSSENERLKIELNDFNSLKLINNKYSELLKSYLKQTDDYLKNIQAFKINETEQKFDNFVVNSERLIDFESLDKSHNTLQLGQGKYFSVVENMRLLIEFIKNSDRNMSISFKNVKDDSEGVFASLKQIISEVLDLKKKLYDANSLLTSINKEKSELQNPFEAMNSLSKHSPEKSANDEMQQLLNKEQEECENLKKIIENYNQEVAKILTLLEFPDIEIAQNKFWDVIKEKIVQYRNVDKIYSLENESESILQLEKKVRTLESDLLDVDNFKRKFSKELHELKPDLKVSDLMKLSLENLQLTMWTTIMEKESAIISNLEKDYENKLASNSDKIKQLEEETRRKIDWIQEIESENDRLQNEFKEVLSNNENLKSDIKDKVDKIIILEKKIEEQKNNVNQSLLCDSHNEQDQKEQEKSFTEYSLQEKVINLSRALAEKSKECEDAFNSLQSKSKTIFQLEKLVKDMNNEKSHLEEEIKRLVEDLNSQALSSKEIEMKLKLDFDQYKDTLENADGKSGNKMCLQDTDSQISMIRMIEKLSKEFDLILEKSVISLDIHSKKVETLNNTINELKNKLRKRKEQSIELENKERIIADLKGELSALKEMEAVVRNGTLLTAEDVNQLETLTQEKTLLTKELENLRSQLTYIEEEKEALIHESAENQEALKNRISSLCDCLKVCQAELESCNLNNKELVEFREECKKLKEEILVKNEQIQNGQEKLQCLLKENSELNEKYLGYHQLKDEFSKYQLESQTEIQTLKDQLSKQQLEDLSSLNEKVCFLNNKVTEQEKVIERFELEKGVLTKEFLDNLEFEKSLLNSTKLELIAKQNDFLNLQKEKEKLSQELAKIQQTENLRFVSLEKEIKNLNNLNEELNSKLASFQQVINEKDLNIQNLLTELKTFQVNHHPEDKCPFKKEAQDNKIKSDEFRDLLTHERDRFQLWKTNFEEDIRCKVLLIGDLESKLKKETQNYKDVISSNAELHQCLIETEGKMKKLEDKISMQREVFIKEKSKLEQEIKQKDTCEQTNFELRNKCKEYVESINTFLQKLSNILSKNISDLEAAFNEFTQLQSALEDEKDSVKQLDEECEILNTNIKHLENELGKIYLNEREKSEMLHQESEKLRNEQFQNEKLTSELKEAYNRLCLVKKDMDELTINYKKEKDAYELNINNLLEDKHNLQLQCSNMEKKVSELLSNVEQLQKKESHKIEELTKEINYLKIQIVHKNTKISNLEMRFESNGLPFQKRAETAEKKVEELSKELKSLTYSLNSRDKGFTSPLALKVDSDSSRRAEEYLRTIAQLEEEVKILQRDKSSLKKIAILRHKENKELQEKLGLRPTEESSRQES